MWINRAYYIFAVGVSALFFVLYPHWFAWYLLVFLLLLMPFDLLISLPGMLTRGVALAAPSILEQREQGVFAVAAKPRRNLPTGPLKARIKMTFDDRTVTRQINRLDSRIGRYELEINMAHCGIMFYEICNLRATSVMGLFSFPIPSGAKTSTLIMPAPIEPPSSIALPQSMRLRPKPGGGYAEEHDIRPFREGDMINTVHWKLSAKHDSLIVREPLEPVPQERLIIAKEWNSPYEREIVLGRLRWVSEYLTERGLPHYVKIAAYSQPMQVASPDDLATCIHLALGGNIPPPPALPPIRFTWTFTVSRQ